MLILDRAAVEASLTMAACIEAVETALHDRAQGLVASFPRFEARAAGDARMGLMPVRAAGTHPLWCVKAVVYAPGNPARGLEGHQGAILLQDGDTGEVRAIVDAGAVTALRTAAASAVATRRLARPGARRVAILGTGRQARAHIDAMRVVLPGAQIVVWGRRPHATAALAAAADVEVAATPEAALDDADVVCTVTGARTPILALAWLKAGCHINAVGASALDAREIGTDVVTTAERFVDSLAQARVECGEVLIPISEGVLDPEDVATEIGDVLAGRHPGRSGPDAVTLFKSLGLAVEDLAAARAAVQATNANGLAQTVTW